MQKISYYLFENQVFSQSLRKLVLCLKSIFWGEILFCVQKNVLIENSKNQILLKISASIKLRLLYLLKRNTYQIQPDGILKTPCAQNLTFCVSKSSLSANLRKLVLCLLSIFGLEIVFCVKIVLFWSENNFYSKLAHR